MKIFNIAAVFSNSLGNQKLNIYASIWIEGALAWSVSVWLIIDTVLAVI